jgi:hypothetical protein
MGAFYYTMAALSSGAIGVTIAGLTIVLMIVALVRQEPWVMMLAGLCTIPYTYTLGSWQGIQLAIRLMPLLVFGSAYAIGRREMLIAWILPILPLVIVLSFVLRIVASQIIGF